MPDQLPTGIVRADVESFIREKGVTKVPRGASGIFDEHGNYINNPLKRGRPSGRPKKAPPPAPKPDPVPEPHIPARRANVERFAAAMEAEPKAPEKPQEARAAPSPVPAPEGRSASTPQPQRKPDEDRRAQYREACDGTRTAREVAEQLGVAVVTVRKVADTLGLPLKPGVPGGHGGERAAAADAKKARIREMHGQGAVVKEIAAGLDLTEARVYQLLKELGLRPNRKSLPEKATPPSEPKKPNPKRPGRNGAADVKKAERAERHAGIVADRRRFRTVSVPMGEPAVELASDHEAVPDGRTYFPSRVFEPSAEDRVLIDGCNNSKIGGDVLVGWLKGARIYTLTLEERATCPDTCPLWRGCYGNAMQWSRRWRHGPALERRIAAEVRQLCKAHDRILIRLHILGDFYSTDYVDLWRGLLIEYGGLHVFGFTAWGEDTELGAAVASVRAAFPRRWWVRHSGRTGPWGSFTIDFPTSKKRIGDALVCPEQRDGMQGSKEGRHCGNCAACWSSDVPICFVEH